MNPYKLLLINVKNQAVKLIEITDSRDYNLQARIKVRIEYKLIKGLRFIFVK